MAGDQRFHFHPLTPDRWTDLETLFGPRGSQPRPIMRYIIKDKV